MAKVVAAAHYWNSEWCLCGLKFGVMGGESDSRRTRGQNMIVVVAEEAHGQPVGYEANEAACQQAQTGWDGGKVGQSVEDGEVGTQHQHVAGKKRGRADRGVGDNVRRVAWRLA